MRVSDWAEIVLISANLMNAAIINDLVIVSFFLNSSCAKSLTMSTTIDWPLSLMAQNGSLYGFNPVDFSKSNAVSDWKQSRLAAGLSHE